MPRVSRRVTDWVAELSGAEYAVLTGGFAAGVLLLVGVLRHDSLLVEALTMGVSVAAFFYWFGLDGER